MIVPSLITSAMQFGVTPNKRTHMPLDVALSEECMCHFHPSGVFKMNLNWIRIPPAMETYFNICVLGLF